MALLVVAALSVLVGAGESLVIMSSMSCAVLGSANRT